MIDPDVFYRLREAQLRAVHEQEVLSGRNWILISAFVHVLAMVYPVFLWIHVLELHSVPLNQALHPAVNVGFTVLSCGALLVFWWWARFAPYRAALGALLTFIVILAIHTSIDPRQLVVGATAKALILLGLLQAVFVGHRRRRPL